jgi:two-component system response regulator PrrA
VSESSPPSVLVVDDDEGVALTFSRMLRLHGYHVDTATTPEDGLTLVSQHTPDAIILDLRMPLVSGVEFLRRLRRGDHHQTSVTIVTGDYFIEDELSDEIKSLGADVCFKPIWVDDLVLVVDKMLGGTPPPATACA